MRGLLRLPATQHSPAPEAPRLSVLKKQRPTPTRIIKLQMLSSPRNLDRNALLQGLSTGCAGGHQISFFESGDDGRLGKV